MDNQAALIKAAQQGERAAFTQLVTQFQNVAYAIAYSAVSDRHLAEEVAQEAFIEVYRHLGQLTEPAAFPGWLRTITLRQVNRLTRRKRLPLVDLAAADGVATTTPAMSMATTTADVQGDHRTGGRCQYERGLVGGHTAALGSR